jgi:AraC-like DNA-binding protein
MEDRIRLFEEIYLNLEMGYGRENLYFANMTLWYFLSSFLFVSQFRQIKRLYGKEFPATTISFMKENLDKTLTLQDLAGRSGYSVSHFTTLFRSKTGYTPVDYFINLKLQRACQYLDMTDLRVKEIADQLGYTDPYYFSRLFRNHIGISPGQYRKNKKG